MTYRLFISALLCLLSSLNDSAQTLTPDRVLERQLRASGVLSRPLPVETGRSLEVEQLQQKVVKREYLSP